MLCHIWIRVDAVGMCGCVAQILVGASAISTQFHVFEQKFNVRLRAGVSIPTVTWLSA
jgi:hypothetical protein